VTLTGVTTLGFGLMVLPMMGEGKGFVAWFNVKTNNTDYALLRT